MWAFSVTFKAKLGWYVSDQSVLEQLSHPLQLFHWVESLSKYSQSPQNIFDPSTSKSSTINENISCAGKSFGISCTLSPFDGNRERHQWLLQYLVSFRGSLTSLFTSIFPWKSFAYIKAIKAQRVLAVEARKTKLFG